jgi:hypothetical protein
MGQKETAVTGKNRIMIYGPGNDGTYIVEFRTDAGERSRSQSQEPRPASFGTSKSVCPTGCLCRTFREEPLARSVSYLSGALI